MRLSLSWLHVLKLDQPFVQSLCLAKQLSGLLDLRSVAECVAALDQCQHPLRGLNVKPDAVMEFERTRNRGQSRRRFSLWWSGLPRH
jgi:hypothetical protein